MAEEVDKKKQDSVVVPKKALVWIAPAVAIMAVLLSGHKAPEALLFLMGIISGILIAKGFSKNE